MLKPDFKIHVGSLIALSLVGALSLSGCHVMTSTVALSMQEEQAYQPGVTYTISDQAPGSSDSTTQKSERSPKPQTRLASAQSSSRRQMSSSSRRQTNMPQQNGRGLLDRLFPPERLTAQGASSQPESTNQTKLTQQIQQSQQSESKRGQYNKAKGKSQGKPGKPAHFVSMARDFFAGGNKKWDEEIAEARQLDMEGDCDAAISRYEALIERGCDKSLIFHRLAVLYDKTERFEQSVKYYERALEKDPGNVELLCDFGYRWHLLDNPALAERYYRLALDIKPRHQRTHNNLGLLYAKANRSDEALQHFRMAGLNEQQAQNNLKAAQNNATP